MTFPTWPTRPRRQRGAVLPSPVVLLSIVAVALAAITFVATRGETRVERDVSATKAAATPSPTDAAAPAPASPSPTPTPAAPAPKPVVRADHRVVVFNNTKIKGLAAKVSATVEKAGWKVAGADNWYGTVPATTVYFPQGKRAAARQLALDLGVARVQPADTNMSTSNLTLILTGEL